MELCLANRTELGAKVDCQKETSGGYMSSYALFVLAMVVAGAGCTPMYALGVPYMDENVKAKVSPMYVGIFLASGIIGELKQSSKNREFIYRTPPFGDSAHPLL